MIAKSGFENSDQSLKNFSGQQINISFDLPECEKEANTALRAYEFNIFIRDIFNELDKRIKNESSNETRNSLQSFLTFIHNKSEELDIAHLLSD